MTVDVRTAIEIARPARVVFGYAAEPDNAPAWYEKIRSIEWETEPPLSVGSRIAFVAHFLGRRLAYTYEVVELVANTKLVMRTAGAPFAMETTYFFEPLGEKLTRMTLHNRGEPRGFGGLVAPLVERAIAHANDKDLARLKSILEVSDPRG